MTLILIKQGMNHPDIPYCYEQTFIIYIVYKILPRLIRKKESRVLNYHSEIMDAIKDISVSLMTFKRKLADRNLLVNLTVSKMKTTKVSCDLHSSYVMVLRLCLRDISQSRWSGNFFALF